MSDKPVLITMIKKSLDDIIDVPFADGYTMRRYAKGDRDMWIALYDRLDEYYHVTPKDFDESYGDDRDEIGKYVYFLMHEGKEIGTVANWPEPDMNGQKTGRVRWLGVEDGHRGKHLGAAMLSFILQDMKQQGCTQSILGTMNRRVAALNLYFKFGFEAIVYTDQWSAIDDQSEAWSALKDTMPKEYQGMINI